MDIDQHIKAMHKRRQDAVDRIATVVPILATYCPYMGRREPQIPFVDHLRRALAINSLGETVTIDIEDLAVLFEKTYKAGQKSGYAKGYNKAWRRG